MSAALQDSGAPTTFFCYLLHSLADPSKGHTYIGFTVNPLRRLKQHNGTLRAGGARHTSRKRPWAMVAVVHGFPTKIAALQFEWAWQFPRASRLVRGLLEREAAANGLSEGGGGGGGGRSRRAAASKLYGTRPRGQLNLLYAMLALQPWCHYALHVRYLRQEDYESFHACAPASGRAGCSIDPAIRAGLPGHMDVSYGPLEQLEWAATLTKTGRRAASARGEGDTLGGGEAIFLDVPPVPTAPRGKNARAAASVAAAAGGGAMIDANGDDDDDDDDDAEVELEEEEREHELVLDDADPFGEGGVGAGGAGASDDDDFSLSQSIASSSAAAAARAAALEEQERSDRAYAHALARAESHCGFGDDPADADVGFRFDEASNSFVLVDDAEEDDEVDLTHFGANAASAAAAASSAAAISTPAVAASSSSSSAAAATSSRDSTCPLCEPRAGTVSATATPLVPQLSHFGFHNLMSVCPHCRSTAHLLCFQRRMQSLHQPPPQSSTAAERPLLPAPAPCPFCDRTTPWCALVENSHRFHAPVAGGVSTAPVSSGGAAAVPSEPRTLGQYFIDAGVKFRQIAHLQMMQLWREAKAAKLAKAAAAAASAAAGAKKPRSKAGSSSVASSPAAPVQAIVVRRECGENKENLPAAMGASGGPRAKPRKRRSRSLSPSRALAGAGADSPRTAAAAAAGEDSPSATAHSRRERDPTLPKSKRRAAPTTAAAATAIPTASPAPLGPVRSLSLPMMHADNVAAAGAPVALSKSSSRALVRAAAAAAAAASLNSIPIAEDDEEAERAWCGSQSQSQVRSFLSQPCGSQRSGADASEGSSSEIDLTQGPSLWDRCSATAAVTAATAASGAALSSVPTRPQRSSSAAAATSSAAPRAPLSPIQIEDSDCESVGADSPAKPVSRPAAAAAAKSKPGRTAASASASAAATRPLEEVGLMERLKSKYGVEQIVLSL